MERSGFIAEGEQSEYEDKEVLRYIILNNYKTVDTSCLSYIPTNYNSRCKYYNKFVCQLTCPSIMRSFGSRVADFLFPSDKRLTSTFKNIESVKCGPTRLECTVSGGRKPEEDDLKK